MATQIWVAAKNHCRIEGILEKSVRNWHHWLYRLALHPLAERSQAGLSPFCLVAGFAMRLKAPIIIRQRGDIAGNEHERDNPPGEHSTAG